MDLGIDPGYVTDTLRDLVRISSINPMFGDGKTNEAEIAEYVAARLASLGCEVARYEPEPGRTSVVGRLVGSGGGPSLMLNAHMDTVGVERMAEPFSGAIRDGRVYGRGAYDMKGALAACIGAVKAIRDAGVRLRGDVLVTAVADEEAASIGMVDVLKHVTADAAIVTEATHLRVCLAHKGFCWVAVETFGRAAHGSRFREGIDANMRMGRLLAELEGLERALRNSPGHPLVGPPSLHAAVLKGGTGLSTYAAQCRLEIERRTIPGETAQDVLTEIRRLVDRLAAQDPTFKAEVTLLLARDAFENSPDAPIVRVVREEARQVLGREPEVIGEPYWMDAAFLAAAGIDTVVIGPTGTGAHAAEEWVDLDSVLQLTDILAGSAIAFCGIR